MPSAGPASSQRGRSRAPRRRGTRARTPATTAARGPRAAAAGPPPSSVVVARVQQRRGEQREAERERRAQAEEPAAWGPAPGRRRGRGRRGRGDGEAPEAHAQEGGHPSRVERRGWSGHEAGEHVLGALQVLADQPRRAARVAALEQRDELACWGLERSSTSGGCAMWPISSLIAPWTSVIAATSRDEPAPRRARGGRTRRPAGRPRSPRLAHHVDVRLERARSAARRARRRARRRRPRSRRGSRAARATRLSSTRLALRRRERLGDEPAAAAAAHGDRWPLWTSAVSAWRSVEREIPSWAAQVALRRAAARRARAAQADRRAEPLDRLLERLDGRTG